MKLWVKAYGTAVLTTAVALLVDVLLGDRLSESSAGLFIAAAMISARYGGLGAGLGAVVLSVALNLIFFNHPYFALAAGVHGPERALVFAAAGVLVAWLTARGRRSESELTRLNRDLESEVQKRTAALTESNKQLEAFCYTLAHDLRSPLRSIQGFAHFLESDHGLMLNPETRRCVERIRNSAERMGRLIVDLLAYTQLTRATFERREIDLDEIIRDAIRLFSDEIERTQADISVDLSAEIVYGDRAGVERAFVNLLRNAFNYADPGRPPRIHIFTERKEHVVRVWVEDNGVGLDPKYSDRIFGVFERLPGLQNPSGTGIGLAIAKRSVEKMGGDIGVESVPGVGSRFWFELPEGPVAVLGTA